MASIKYDHDRLYELMFSRNKLVLNEENQRKIKNSSVAVLGLGGVGSPLCELLMRAGFVNVTIVARGVYELGNINRQLAATYISVNARIPKASAMAERMLEVNPFCNINILRSNVKNDGKIKNVLKKENVKIVFNCVDEFLAQVSVAKIAREINAMMIVGGVVGLGTEGFVAVFRDVVYEKLLNLDSLIKEVNQIKHGSIDMKIKEYWFKKNSSFMSNELRKRYQAELGTPYPVLTHVPWIIASIMVSEAIKLITHIKETNFVPKVVLIDGLKPSVEIVDLSEKRHLVDLLIPWRP